MKFLALVSFLIMATFTQAQNDKKFFVSVDYQVKFTLGEESFQTLQGQYFEGTFEKQLSYPNPINQITFTANYQLRKTLSIGIGGGMNVSKYIPNPSRWNDFYDKVGFPFFFQATYSVLSSDNWTVLSNVFAGYQFSDAYLAHYNYEWTSIESGGFMTGLDFQIAYTKSMYSPFLIVGYEYNQFNNFRRLGMSDGTTSVTDDFEFNTFCHLLKMGVGIKF